MCGFCWSTAQHKENESAKCSFLLAQPAFASDLPTTASLCNNWFDPAVAPPTQQHFYDRKIISLLRCCYDTGMMCLSYDTKQSTMHHPSHVFIPITIWNHTIVILERQTLQCNGVSFLSVRLLSHAPANQNLCDHLDCSCAGGDVQTRWSLSLTLQIARFTHFLTASPPGRESPTTSITQVRLVIHKLWKLCLHLAGHYYVTNQPTDQPTDWQMD